MKIPPFLKYTSMVFGSIFLIASAVDAKPDKAGKGGKDKGAAQAEGKGGKDKGDAQAQGKGGKDKDKGRGPEQAQHKDKPNRGGPKDRPQIPVWKDDQRNSIVRYFDDYQKNNQGLPPGLAMNQRRGKALPPGWEKKYVAGSVIEEDEWTSFEPVPNEWFPDLQMEPDTRLYHYGDRVVRVYEPEREILEVVLLNLLR
jgi:hypothetical protein